MPRVRVREGLMNLIMRIAQAHADDALELGQARPASMANRNRHQLIDLSPDKSNETP